MAVGNLTFGKLFRRIIVVSLLGVAAYLLAQVFILTNPTYTYETVIQYSYTDSITAQGYVLFEETFVEGSGNLGFLVEDGARVSAGQAVAEYYTSDTQQTLRAQLDATNAEIALLEDSENTSGTLVNNLISQRSTAIYSLLAQLDQGDYADVQENESAFLLAQNKLQITTGDATDFSSRIALLTEQSQALSEALGTLTELAAPSNGYFVSKNSAQFLSYQKEELLELSVSDFAQTLAEDSIIQSDALAGKVVSSYTWYFVGLCTSEESTRFVVGDSLELSFPDKTDTLFPASVVSVELEEETGLARVVLMCEYIGADALSLGQETAEIIFETYQGLRVPSDAVRMQAVETGEDGGEEYIKGVYVAYNGLAKFRQIEILYQVDGYILVPLEGESDVSTVRMYDQVIISGTDLSDGKLL